MKRDLRNQPDRPRGRAPRTALWLAGGMAGVLGLGGPGSQAWAQLTSQQQFLDPNYPGQPVGFAVELALYACSLASIAGNVINIELKNHQRGWMYSGYICGFVNALISPILILYFQTPPAYGTTSGVLHGILGSTNLGVAIYNGALWSRKRTATPKPPKLALMPFVGRDRLGALVLGLGVGLSGL